jgi:hypothetical protein
MVYSYEQVFDLNEKLMRREELVEYDETQRLEIMMTERGCDAASPTIDEEEDLDGCLADSPVSHGVEEEKVACFPELTLGEIRDLAGRTGTDFDLLRSWFCRLEVIYAFQAINKRLPQATRDEIFSSTGIKLKRLIHKLTGIELV